MHHADENVTWLLKFFSQIVPSEIDERRLARLITHGQKSRWFVDRQAMIVFV
jgi:hypothetical protein